ncbi:DNA-binding transcriptional activator of the SARP family [Nonomuraea solani]|uniref:DNA-binding transcriptional activator of the SARP family n=1 Tax=Nonomuraea solani TaxID=1144553 RepID=A0A1H6DJQ6_9ACTN|nr:BTAD domain-containing putative transcriptional regulator [Nonomuraea solani]SEG85530.1 DNA-binding transcriptional activator of the SARP family [Nonomuraea solani]
MSKGIFIRLLGAVTGERQGGAAAEVIDLGPARQQSTLVILASAAAHPVPMDRLVAGIWGDEAPRNAEQSVYTYIAGLRRALEPDRRRREPSRLLAGTPAGYVLGLRPDQVDALVFAERLSEAQGARHKGDDLQAVCLLGEALELWRGTALSGLPGPFAAKERARLEQSRLTALESRAESLLRLGRHQETIDELRDLTHHHPLRERVRELLMTALFRSGRRAEALEVYEEGRTVLADELGVSPGEGLRDCHAMVLRADKGAGEAAERPAVPYQLPRPPAEFVGRSRELRRLEARLTPGDDAHPRPLVIVTGPAGVGKSTLAAQAAHLAKDHFPDGQLYVNCRGATPDMPALTALDVLGRFLRGLGVPPDSVPADLDEAAALWRSRLHDRRVLALLDDAADLAQIRPLLATPYGSALLVTSRETMTWSEEADQLELGRMTPEESATMLARLAGTGRVSADAGETARLVRLCDGLPLALRIAGARLAGRPGWSVAALAARLSDERRRLHELAAGDLAVRSSLASSHTALERGSRPVDRLAARTLALLGLLHVPEVTAEVAGALLGTSPEEAEPALERLVDAHLLDRTGHDRYQPHDLVRLFAGELRPEGAEEALTRALLYYTASVRRASGVTDPHRVQPGWHVEAVPHAVSGPEEAHAWLVEQEPILNAAARQALASADDTIAGLGANLTFSLLWHQQRVNAMVTMVELNTLALRVSERLGDERGAMQAHAGISAYLRMVMRTDEAVEHLQAELALARKIGDGFEEQKTMGNLAGALVTARRFEEALPWAERQLTLATKIGADVGVRFSLLIRGDALKGLGRLEQARTTLHEALRKTQESGDLFQEAQVRFHLGELHLEQDDPRAALPHFQRARDMLLTTGYAVGRLRSQIGLVRTYRLLGRLDQALRHLGEAVAAGGGLGYDRWERRLRAEQNAVGEALAAKSVICP